MRITFVSLQNWGFPNLFLTVVYGVVYSYVGVDNSQSERRYLYFIE